MQKQQVKLLVHSMNTKGLEAMVPKMIDEAEEYFMAWGDEGEVELRAVFSELIIMTVYHRPNRSFWDLTAILQLALMVHSVRPLLCTGLIVPHGPRDP